MRATARALKRLDVVDNGLCFGRLDAVSGERFYIGRIGLFDEKNDYQPVLLDWRAPAARAFYVATAATPENMRRRRQFHTRGRQVVDFTDEVLGRPGDGATGDAALLAAINAPRGEGMRDIVATIQAEQDEIIRLDHTGVLVIEGGPGTGKTVVALHRVAYLLYTQREQMERHGVLVVGPNPAFLSHIGRVLAVTGRDRRGVQYHRRPRARPAYDCRGRPSGRATQGLAEDAGCARGSGCRSAATAGTAGGD